MSPEGWRPLRLLPAFVTATGIASEMTIFVVTLTDFPTPKAEPIPLPGSIIQLLQKFYIA